jgi:hypothetical protein
VRSLISKVFLGVGLPQLIVLTLICPIFATFGCTLFNTKKWGKQLVVTLIFLLQLYINLKKNCSSSNTHNLDEVAIESFYFSMQA